MSILKTLVVSGSIMLAFNSCTKESVKNETPVPVEQTATPKIMVDGSYATADYEKRKEGYDWVGVIIQNIDDNKISVKIRSRADKKKPSCTLDAEATKTKEGVYHAMLNGKNVIFTFNETSVTIDTENPQDQDGLHFYCSGGASIAGTYTKIDAPLDPAQVDK
ncbi:hypothetical protein SAMN05444360_10449 [Chryseobacterium carnipullorum]|uniref:hypothetical protein n=1 Tax=Chryseobacterium carnipullorum TaxID=1124835 RepID=UPI00091B47CE|nr:hypothetical protein [Chryseobacterium carnipullorum]SHL74668.1 hypothetical protein SAMN05444360_10449 [Chryseobacterium carnipullorum]